jgi:hypothetical protein
VGADNHSVAACGRAQAQSALVVVAVHAGKRTDDDAHAADDVIAPDTFTHQALGGDTTGVHIDQGLPGRAQLPGIPLSGPGRAGIDTTPARATLAGNNGGGDGERHIREYGGKANARPERARDEQSVPTDPAEAGARSNGL